MKEIGKAFKNLGNFNPQYSTLIDRDTLISKPQRLFLAKFPYPEMTPFWPLVHSESPFNVLRFNIDSFSKTHPREMLSLLSFILEDRYYNVSDEPLSEHPIVRLPNCPKKTESRVLDGAILSMVKGFLDNNYDLKALSCYFTDLNFGIRRSQAITNRTLRHLNPLAITNVNSVISLIVEIPNRYRIYLTIASYYAQRFNEEGLLDKDKLRKATFLHNVILEIVITDLNSVQDNYLGIRDHLRDKVYPSVRVYPTVVKRLNQEGVPSFKVTYPDIHHKDIRDNFCVWEGSFDNRSLVLDIGPLSKLPFSVRDTLWDHTYTAPFSFFQKTSSTNPIRAFSVGFDILHSKGELPRTLYIQRVCPSEEPILVYDLREHYKEPERGVLYGYFG